MSIDQVSDLLNNKHVIGDKHDIMEVKNAIDAYKIIDKIDPFNLNNLFLIHKELTKNILKDAGSLRKTNEGVFSGDQCIFVAPQPSLINDLIESLFYWMNSNKDKINLLILSCVFHYEFVFIHPFSDGNGRTARFFQTAILGKYNKIFYALPIENFIKDNQQKYYDSINKSNKEGKSDSFIEFMLHMILFALEEYSNQIQLSSSNYTYIDKLLKIMKNSKEYSLNELMEKLNLKSRSNSVKLCLNPALELNFISRTLKDKKTSKNQKYIKLK